MNADQRGELLFPQTNATVVLKEAALDNINVTCLLLCCADGASSTSIILKRS